MPSTLTFRVGERCFHVYLHKHLLLSKSVWFLNSDNEGSDSRGWCIIGIFDSCISFQIANSKSLTANSLPERLSESIWFLSLGSCLAHQSKYCGYLCRQSACVLVCVDSPWEGTPEVGHWLLLGRVIQL